MFASTPKRLARDITRDGNAFGKCPGGNYRDCSIIASCSRKHAVCAVKRAKNSISPSLSSVIHTPVTVVIAARPGGTGPFDDVGSKITVAFNQN
jgi:hypothetical protein